MSTSQPTPQLTEQMPMLPEQNMVEDHVSSSELSEFKLHDYNPIPKELLAKQISVNVGGNSVVTVPIQKMIVVSVWPEPLVWTADHYSPLAHPTNPGSGRTIVKIPAAPRGSFVAVEVATSVQNEMDLVDSLDTRPDRTKSTVIQAHQVAQSIVTYYQLGTRDIPGHGSMGIGMLWDGATVPPIGGNVDPNSRLHKVLMELVQQQTALFRRHIEEAGRFHMQNKPEGISPRARLGAEWIYGTAGAKSFDWYKKDTFQSLKSCPLCGVNMPAAALLHTPTNGGCGKHLVTDHYQAFGYKEQEVKTLDRAVWLFMKARNLFPQVTLEPLPVVALHNMPGNQPSPTPGRELTAAELLEAKKGKGSR